MTDIKSWWQSKTLWGALITLGSAALSLSGIHVDPADQQTAINLISAIGTAAGGLITIFGRITATHRIG